MLCLLAKSFSFFSLLLQGREGWQCRSEGFSFFSLLLHLPKEDLKRLLSFSFFSLLLLCKYDNTEQINCFSFFSLLHHTQRLAMRRFYVLVSFRCYPLCFSLCKETYKFQFLFVVTIMISLEIGDYSLFQFLFVVTCW